MDFGQKHGVGGFKKKFRILVVSQICTVTMLLGEDSPSQVLLYSFDIKLYAMTGIECPVTVHKL